MTGGTGAASKKQVTNAGSQFGNTWAEEGGTIKRDAKRDCTNLSVGTGGWAGTRGEQPHSQPITISRGTTCTRCGAWAGELGSEPNVAMFVAHLVEVFREVKRVLRDDGVLFCNIGDGYSGSGKGPSKSLSKANGHSQGINSGYVPVGTRPKSLLLVPERLAIALADDGWVIRSRIAWIKAAPMPESVRDRPSSAWEHIWMLTKSSKYYWDAALAREDAKYGRSEVIGSQWNRSREASPQDRRDGGKSTVVPGEGGTRNLWNYWGPLSPDPYPGAHFATFPKEIPKRCILSATSSYGACAACGAPWMRVVERTAATVLAPDSGYGDGAGRNDGGRSMLVGATATTTGWAPTCKCGPAAGVRPCIVLDPFSGSGTTSFVAAQLGRIGVGVELSASYTEQARFGRLAQEFLPI